MAAESFYFPSCVFLYFCGQANFYTFSEVYHAEGLVSVFLTYPHSLSPPLAQKIIVKKINVDLLLPG